MDRLYLHDTRSATCSTSAGSAFLLNEQYYDCRNVTQQKDSNWTGCVSENLYWNGSQSGFWDAWT